MYYGEFTTPGLATGLSKAYCPEFPITNLKGPQRNSASIKLTHGHDSGFPGTYCLGHSEPQEWTTWTIATIQGLRMLLLLWGVILYVVYYNIIVYSIIKLCSTSSAMCSILQRQPQPQQQQ